MYMTWCIYMLYIHTHVYITWSLFHNKLSVRLWTLLYPPSPLPLGRPGGFFSEKDLSDLTWSQVCPRDPDLLQTWIPGVRSGTHVESHLSLWVWWVSVWSWRLRCTWVVSHDFGPNQLSRFRGRLMQWGIKRLPVNDWFLVPISRHKQRAQLCRLQ
jgi:hypothetical protein